MTTGTPASARPPGETNPPDAGFGRGITRTLVIVVAVGLLVTTATFVMDRLAAPPGSTADDPDRAHPNSATPADLPLVRFTDITRSSGIDFVHTNGANGEKLLPETMGGGVAVLDFDNDGRQDLFFVNSTVWPWNSQPGRTSLPIHALYRNLGQNQFTNVTSGSGLDFSCYGMGVAVADFDADGWTDLYLTATGTNYLLRNQGNGKFTDVTSQAGVAGQPEDWSTGAAWFDYDRDDDLDLFVGNYLRWSRVIDFEADYQLPGIGRAYGQPWNFPATFPRLYRNEGNGSFTDVSALSGIQVRNPTTGLPLPKTLGVRPVDINHDGWLDLIVANDTVQNFVFRNEKDGTFKEIGAAAGIAFDSFGGTRGAMGIDSARFKDPDALGVSIGNFANEMTAIYVAQGQTTLFTDEALTEGIGPASRMALTFGVFFFDYDLDGWLDLLTANGHIETDIERVQPTQHYRQSAQLFWNAHGLGATTGFVSVPPAQAGPDLFQPIVGRGSAYADFDLDGDLDVVIAQINGPPLLLRNDQALSPNWLRLQLQGLGANPQAIGAWVRAKVNDITLSRQVMPTRGYLSQSELPVTLGLGHHQQIEELVVRWPDGSQQEVPTTELNAITVITQQR